MLNVWNVPMAGMFSNAELGRVTGCTLAFWRASLGSLQQILEEYGTDLKEDELRFRAHPQLISGPMDF